jgi:hypothetical protein
LSLNKAQALCHFLLKTVANACFLRILRRFLAIFQNLSKMAAQFRKTAAQVSAMAAHRLAAGTHRAIGHVVLPNGEAAVLVCALTIEPARLRPVAAAIRFGPVSL